MADQSACCPERSACRRWPRRECRASDQTYDTDPPERDPTAWHGAAGLGAETQAELLPTREPLRTIFRSIGLVEQAIAVGCIVVILVLVLIQVAQRYLPVAGGHGRARSPGWRSSGARSSCPAT